MKNYMNEGVKRALGELKAELEQMPEEQKRGALALQSWFTRHGFQTGYTRLGNALAKNVVISVRPNGTSDV